MSGKDYAMAKTLTERKYYVYLTDEEVKKFDSLCSLSGLKPGMVFKKLLLSQEIRFWDSRIIRMTTPD